MSARLHNKTPDVSVIDSRGLMVRHIAYYRSSESEVPATPRVTRHTYDTAGHLIEQWDARQDARKLVPNRTMSYSLAGTPLGVVCVDSGWSLSLAQATGQPGRRWDQRGNLWNMEYDRQLRPVRVDEQSPGQAMRVAERFTYGDSSVDSAQRNCCARLVRHDDSAGTLSSNAYALCGEPSDQTRQLLIAAQLPDWPDTVEKRDALLEDRRHTTHWQYDSSGTMLEQTDAKGHTQRYSFNVAGQLKTLHLKIADQPAERVIISDIEYNAFGQIQSQRAANGVINRAKYDMASGRLCELSASKAGRVLQDLQYVFDAVGNVLSIADKAQPASFANNQQVQAVSRFTYDSLYQLTSATGREAQAAITQPKLVPAASMTIAVGELFNYTQQFSYDTGGNLTTLRHVRDGNQYTRNLHIAEDSNRLVAWNQSDPATDTAMGWDVHGNLLTLQPGQPLQWNALNQLAGVTLVSRANGANDEERYTYDGSGQRVRKSRTFHGGTLTHRDEVVYLPGLELRSQNKQRLEVITLQAGRCNIRYLHWTEGKPAAMGSRQQLRYSLDEPCGSCMLELDDDANLISQEAYYPFGGTAWSAARSAIEAQYTTVRHSGKERDSSGLYYYGHRYYAPWLQRWISADPAGTVDGLNLFCMVGNNPIRYSDQGGLQKYESLNHLDIPASAIARAPFAHLIDQPNTSYGRFSTKTRWLTGTPAENAMPEPKAKGKPRRKAQKRSESDPGPPSGKTLKQYIAHASYVMRSGSSEMTTFHNFQGSPAGKDVFLGINSYPTERYREFQVPTMEGAKKKKEDRIDSDFLPPGDLGTYTVASRRRFKKGLREEYRRNGVFLHPETMKLIMNHVRAHSEFPIRAGVAGLHADVQTINDIANKLPLDDKGKFDSIGFRNALSDTVVFVHKLTKPGLNQAFPACGNCTGIIPDTVTVATGILPLGRHAEGSRRRLISG
jgi:insecticidal toxin complex protein TccC